MELATGNRDVFALTATFTDEVIELAALIAGLPPTADDEPHDALVAAVREAARRGGVRHRIAVDVLVEAGKRLEADDLPILGMLVHGTPPGDIASVLGLSGHELARRRQRMLHALLDGQA
jgi:hypothetical protein